MARHAGPLGAVGWGPPQSGWGLGGGSVSEQIDGRSAGGRMVLNLLATVSQWEREVIGERTQVAPPLPR